MKRKKRLTGRELMVSLACAVFVLANLAAVGNAGRRRAKEALCVANLKGWGAIVHTFAQDNGGFFMDRGHTVQWPETMAPYYQNPLLLLCPEARRTYNQGGQNPFMAWPISYGPGDTRGSYGINLWIAAQGRAGSLHPGGTVAYWQTPYVAEPADVPVLIDAQNGNMQPYAFDEPPAHGTDLWTPGPINEIRRACISRHNGGVNAVFLDGSVRKVGLKYLWAIHWHRAWEQELAQSGFPYWPEWMANFKDP
ncbi:MAG: H-X9-DG-CTERM domain-containing protein [Planctomycetota bacterium]